MASNAVMTNDVPSKKNISLVSSMLAHLMVQAKYQISLLEKKNILNIKIEFLK